MQLCHLCFRCLILPICAGKYKQGPKNHQRCKAIQRPTRFKRENGRKAQETWLSTRLQQAKASSQQKANSLKARKR